MTMSPPSYSLATTSMPDIGQARRTIQQPAEPHYTMSMSPLSAVNMTSHTMISCPSQTGFPGSSTSAYLGDSSFAPLSGTYIANSRNGNTATHHFGFAAGPSSHASTSIETTTYSSGVSNGSEAASVHSISTYEHLTQLNGAMIDNAARPRFPTVESVIPMVPGNAPGPQSTFTHLPAINTNQYTGDTSHNTPSLRSSTYRNMVTENNISSSSSLQMPYVPQYVPPNTDLAPPSPCPKSFAHGFGMQHGSQPAGPLHQPAPSMAPSPSTYLQQDLPCRNTHSCPSSGRRRETRAQDAHASSSITLSCNWLDEDDTLCPFQGSLDDLGKHLTSSHLSGPQNALGRCRWQGCLKENDMRRDSVWRHVRETHLNMRRGT